MGQKMNPNGLRVGIIKTGTQNGMQIQNILQII